METKIEWKPCNGIIKVNGVFKKDFVLTGRIINSGRMNLIIKYIYLIIKLNQQTLITTFPIFDPFFS